MNFDRYSPSIEPAARGVDGAEEANDASQSISLKRIADAMERIAARMEAGSPIQSDFRGPDFGAVD